MKNKMGNKEYALLFVISLVVFYTVLSLLTPFTPFQPSSTVVAGVGSGSSGSGSCSGNIQLSFFPDVLDVGGRTSALVSGLQNCNGKVVFLREQFSNDQVLKCTCIVETGNGCGCSFTVENSVCLNKDFYAQIDMNGNGNYNDAGETAIASMNLSGCQLV